MSNRPLEPTTGRWGHCSHEAFRLARGGSTAYTLDGASVSGMVLYARE